MIRFRRYSPGDSAAVAALAAWAMHDAGTDPTDIPGHADVNHIETAYLDAGGEFVVGLRDPAEEAAGDWGPHDRGTFETGDGLVVATGGYLPEESDREAAAESAENSREAAAESVARDDREAVELHRMRVAPPCQGRGYGRQLLAELEERARTEGYSRVLVTTARRQERALALYAGADYRRVGTSRNGAYKLIHFEKSLGGRL